MTILFLDMDGVIADFEQHVADISGVPFSELSEDDVYGVADVDGFFATIPQMKDMNTLMVGLLAWEVPIYILSATGSRTPERVLREKNQWLDANLKDYPIAGRCFATRSRDKKQYAADHTVLIDDRLKALIPFIEAGGAGVLHKSAEETLNKLGAAIMETRTYPF